METPVRRYLAEIGRRGGTRSRRALSPEQARAMVAAREARRALSEFERSPFTTAVPSLPGVELVGKGLHDLAARIVSDESLLVSVAAPRLRLLGIRVPVAHTDPEAQLYDRLAARLGNGAHSQYNALIRRAVSFARAAALVGRHGA